MSTQFKKPTKSYEQLRSEIMAEINAYKYTCNMHKYKKSIEEKALLKELKKTSNKVFTQHIILN